MTDALSHGVSIVVLLAAAAGVLAWDMARKRKPRRFECEGKAYFRLADGRFLHESRSEVFGIELRENLEFAYEMRRTSEIRLRREMSADGSGRGKGFLASLLISNADGWAFAGEGWHGGVREDFGYPAGNWLQGWGR